MCVSIEARGSGDRENTFSLLVLISLKEGEDEGGKFSNTLSLILCLLMMSVSSVMALGEACQGNFDYDQDIDT